MTALTVLILIVGLCASWLAWEATRDCSAWDEWHDGLDALERVHRSE